MDGRLFRRNQPPASTLLRGTVVPTSLPIDLSILARADFANGHDVRFCWDCKTARLSSTRSECPLLRCSTATFTALAAGGVVADGLPDLRRPGAFKSHLDLTELTGLRASVLEIFDEPTTTTPVGATYRTAATRTCGSKIDGS